MSGIVASTLPWRGHFSGPGAQHTIAALRLHAERWGRGSGVTPQRVDELVAASWVDVGVAQDDARETVMAPAPQVWGRLDGIGKPPDVVR